MGLGTEPVSTSSFGETHHSGQRTQKDAALELEDNQPYTEHGYGPLRKLKKYTVKDTRELKWYTSIHVFNTKEDDNKGTKKKRHLETKL